MRGSSFRFTRCGVWGRHQNSEVRGKSCTHTHTHTHTHLPRCVHAHCLAIVSMKSNTHFCKGTLTAEIQRSEVIHTHIYIHAHTYMYTHTYMYIHTYIHTYIHIYMYIHTIHTYTHTCTYIHTCIQHIKSLTVLSVLLVSSSACLPKIH